MEQSRKVDASWKICKFSQDCSMKESDPGTSDPLMVSSLLHSTADPGHLPMEMCPKQGHGRRGGIQEVLPHP